MTHEDPHTTRRFGAFAELTARDREQFPRLLVIRGDPFGKQFEVSAEGLIIGRSSGCDIQFGQANVSRRHCRVWREGERYHIEDLGSTNATRVNGEPITDGQLHNGDRIGIGETVLKFIITDQAEADYHAELYSRASLDGLTGVANRRIFDDALRDRIDQAQTRAESLSLALIDLDQFKVINDEHGHPTGDKVLVAVANYLAEAVDSSLHLLARVGGEEFGLILRQMDVREACQWVDELRAMVADRPIRLPEDGLDELTITFSAGVADYRSGTSAAELYRQADRALFKAKRRGRNRVSRSS